MLFCVDFVLWRVKYIDGYLIWVVIWWWWLNFWCVVSVSCLFKFWTGRVCFGIWSTSGWCFCWLIVCFGWYWCDFCLFFLGIYYFLGVSIVFYWMGICGRCSCWVLFSRGSCLKARGIVFCARVLIGLGFCVWLWYYWFVDVKYMFYYVSCCFVFMIVLCIFNFCFFVVASF